MAFRMIMLMWSLGPLSVPASLKLCIASLRALTERGSRVEVSVAASHIIDTSHFSACHDTTDVGAPSWSSATLGFQSQIAVSRE